MIITNLSQLKRALGRGHIFEIVEHFRCPERNGEKRIVNKLQTNGMYTGIYGNPDADISRANQGLGSWIDFGKASDWTFASGVCHQKYHGMPIWTIRVLDDVV